MSGVTYPREILIPKTHGDSPTLSAKSVYFSLLDPAAKQPQAAGSLAFLQDTLASVQPGSNDMPSHIEHMASWLTERNVQVGLQYQSYLAGRQAGEPRRYFQSRSHALYFLRAVAPTKMVDGAWLYGLIRYWHDSRFSALINTYLEELGDGVPAMHHVLLYRKLLRGLECDDWQGLDERFFTQGALQLALAAHTDTHLPEVIGFNLGYEQLPLHLLITAYELKELNIDPYYFTLHITIDNAHTGHARKALEAVKDNMPLLGDTRQYMARVIAGAALNDAGLGTLDIIHGFNPESEVLRILRSKAVIGQHMHADRCLLLGKTINQWLSDAAQMQAFLQTLRCKGWIRRHQDPEASPFWKMISGEKAPMFGVFTGYEKQVIYDWIAGDVLEQMPKIARLGKPWRNAAPASAEQALTVVYDHSTPAVGNVVALRRSQRAAPPNDIHADLHAFEQALTRLADGSKKMDFLVPWLSPAKHHTLPGLSATRAFKAGMDARY